MKQAIMVTNNNETHHQPSSQFFMTRYRQTISHIRGLPSTFWVVLGATLMNQLGNMAIVFIMLYLNQQAGLSLSASAFAFAVFSASTLIAGLFGGGLIDKLGASRIMIATLLLNGITLISFPFATAYGVIIVLCLLWGLAYGLYRPASQTFLAHLGTPGTHKITFSLHRLVLNLGMSIGPALGGFLATHSFFSIFYINGIANLLASLILMAGLNKTRCPTITTKVPALGITCLKHDLALRLFVLGMIPISMVFFQHESTLAIFLTNQMHLSMSFYGLLFTMNTLMIVCLELPLNVATFHWPYRVNFILGSMLISAGFAGIYFASLPSHILFLTILWTLGEMILYPSASSYIADIAPASQRGSYMAMYSTCSNLGMLFGPWSGAIIMQQLGAYALWIACGFWGLLSTVMFYHLREKGSLENKDSNALPSTNAKSVN